MVIERCILVIVPRVLLQGVGSGKAGALVCLVPRHLPSAHYGTLHIVGVEYIAGHLDYISVHVIAVWVPRLLSSFYKWEAWGSEMLSHSPEVTQLFTGATGPYFGMLQGCVIWWKLIVHISSQGCAQWYHVGSLKLTIVRVFTLWKSANAISQGFFFFSFLLRAACEWCWEVDCQSYSAW